METTHQEMIASPLPYIMKVTDQRVTGRCEYSFETLTKLALLAMLAKPENILALSQWLQDQAQSLYDLGFRTIRGAKRLPSQATMYRYFWCLEENITALEHHLKRWAQTVIRQTRQAGQPLAIAFDGKHIKGSKRVRQGEKAKQLMSAYVQELGLSLGHIEVTKSEPAAAKTLLASIGLEGIPWVFTGDAAFAERPVIDTVVQQQGCYLVALKDNLSDVKDYAQWAFSLDACELDRHYSDSEIRSGEVWFWDIDTRPATPEMTNDFPDAAQFIRCQRTVILKSTGELRSQETDYALTSALADAATLYRWWRGHWQIENCSHHKRDTIWREDACRSQLAAHALASFRTLVLSLFQLNGVQQVLRLTRRFTIHPYLAFDFLGFT